MEKRVFNEEKTQELQSYDLSKGKLQEDQIFIKHHKAQEEIQEQSHEEVIAEYPNGGKDVRRVIDVPYQPAREAYDEYEEIYVYKPYTEEELAVRAEQRYKSTVIAEIRKRYSLDDEIALHRQREAKPGEWEEYNAYCEQCKSKAKKIKIEVGK